MKTLAFIRTHVWDDACERLLHRLQSVPDLNLAVVFHNPPQDLEIGIPIIPMTAAWAKEINLFTPKDWGWRCGDYCFYAARAAMPDYEYYWLIEPDVHFTSDPVDFFAAFTSAPEDLLGYSPEKTDRQMRFTQNLLDGDIHRAVYALTRISGRAIDYLQKKRQIDSIERPSNRFWPNDEFFSWTWVEDNTDLTAGALEKYAPSWFEQNALTPGPDQLLDHVQVSVAPGRVMHPVRDRVSYLSAIADRSLTAVSRFLPSKEMFKYFHEAELKAHADNFSATYRGFLYHGTGRAALGEVRMIDDTSEPDTPQRSEPSMTVDAYYPELTLPDHEADTVRHYYATVGTILEYGSGGSTMVAAQKSGRKVFSVESDQAWADRMQTVLDDKGYAQDVTMHHVNIGATKEWGKPVDTSAFKNWPNYAISVWDRPDFEHPDLVLIDGRFRLACFLVTLVRCQKPMIVLWDDYTKRKSYHVAETLVKRVETIGRMVRFEITPGLFKPEHLGLLASSLLDPE